ncbi:MAG: InlB B-repeat-containing protein [Bacilli bacterium]|nr:InlB B-repeat-containing protein [Bacilli bacterium]
MKRALTLSFLLFPLALTSCGGGEDPHPSRNYSLTLAADTWCQLDVEGKYYKYNETANGVIKINDSVQAFYDLPDTITVYDSVKEVVPTTKYQYQLSEDAKTANFSIKMEDAYVISLASIETTCEVTFDTDGGTGEIETQYVKPGFHAEEPAVSPTREGFKFTGWYEDKFDQKPYDFTKRIVTTDLHLIAKWQSEKWVYFEPLTSDTQIQVVTHGDFSLADDIELYFSYNPTDEVKNMTRWTATAMPEAGKNFVIATKGSEVSFAKNRNDYLSFTCNKGGSFNVNGPIASTNAIHEYGFYHLFEGAPVVNASNLLLYFEELPDSMCEGMFINCNQLLSVPNIVIPKVEEPIIGITPGDYTFASMFEGCSELSSADSLIFGEGEKYSEVKNSSSFEKMFKDCTKLVEPPHLNYSRLLGAFYPCHSCYESMFENCRSLKVGPALSATSLSDSCYKNMFKGCTSLERIGSELPAADLFPACYESMFEGCSSLTVAPIIKARQYHQEITDHDLFTACRYMFKNCSALNSVEIHLATFGGYVSTAIDWLMGAATTGTIYCYSGLKEEFGWGDYPRFLNPNNWAIEEIDG